jgi:tyrosine-protein kinase Etk/Wzc
LEKKINKFSVDEFRKLGLKVLRRWYIILISIGIAFAVSFLINRYSIPVYNVKSSLSIKRYDARKAQAPGPLNAVDGDYFFSTERDINKECVRLKSFDNVYNTIQKLNFKISYYNEGSIKTLELFPSSPIRVNYDSTSANIPYDLFIRCIIENDSSYSLNSNNEDWNRNHGGKHYFFGKIYQVNHFTFSVDLLQPYILKKDWGIPCFKINNLRNLASRYQNSLLISPTTKGSSILNITLNSINPKKDIVFLNAFQIFLVEKGLLDKRELAIKTIDFLESQIKALGDSLNQFSGSLENYKIKSIDKGTSSSVLQEIKAFEEKKQSFILNLNYLNYLNDYIQRKSEDEPFSPYHLGLNDLPLTKLFEKFSEFRFETILLKKESNKNNPLMHDRASKLAEMEKTIVENIKNQSHYYQKAIDELDEKISWNLASIKNLL